MTDLFATYQPGKGASGPIVPVVVRPASLADAPRLAELMWAREGGDHSEHHDRFVAEMADADRLVVVAELDHEVVGFGRVRHVRVPSPRPANACPDGWYLAGVIVAPPARRCGVGRALTHGRLAWILERSREAYYVVNARNLASIDLHAAFGFEQVTRDFHFPGVAFTGGVGILFRLVF